MARYRYESPLDRALSLGGRIRALSGLARVVQAIAVAAGWVVSWAAVVEFWDAMPLFWWKVPAVATTAGICFLIAVGGFSVWRRAPALPDSFYQDKREFSRNVQTFTEVLYQLYYTFAQKQGDNIKVWSRVVERNNEQHLEDFAASVYVPNGNTSPGGFHSRMKIGGSVPLDRFEEFHRARSAITAFLQRWYPRLRRDRRAREQAIELLAVTSNARVMAVLERLEDQLARALGNEPRHNAAWRKMSVLIRAEAENDAV